MGDEVKTKISQFCHVPPEDIFGIHNVSNIFRVPLLMHDQGVTERVRVAHDRLPSRTSSWTWVDD